MRVSDLSVLPSAPVKGGANFFVLTFSVVLAYVLTGRIAMLLALPPMNAAAIFPPAGIAAAAYFIAGRRTLLGIFMGSWLLNLWVAHSSNNYSPLFGPLIYTLIAFACTAQAAIAGELLRKFLGYPCAFDRARDISFFLLFSPLFCLVSASIVVIGLVGVGTLPRELAASVWLIWWLADTMGVIIAFPIVMVLVGEPRALWRKRRFALVLPLLIATAFFAFMYVQARNWEEWESLNYLRTQIGWQSWTVLVLGLFGTGLLGAFLLLSSGYAARVELEVERGLQALHESTEKLRGVFELSPLGIAISDMSGHFIEFNEAFCQIVGYSSAELRALDPKELTPPEYREQSFRLYKNAVVDGRYGPLEKSYRRKDGALVPVSLNGMLFKGKNGETYICSIVEDISQRKRTEQALRDSEERWQFALEGAGDGVWDLDLQTREMFLSARNMEMLGYEAKWTRLSSEQWKALVYPPDLERGKALLVDHIERGISTYVFDFRALTHDGQWQWLRRRGKIVGNLPNGLPSRMVGTHTDIDHEKRREHRDGLQSIAMGMIARGANIFDLLKIIAKSLHESGPELVYAIFMGRGAQFSLATQEQFHGDSCRQIIAIDPHQQSGGSAVLDKKILHVPISTNTLSQHFASMASESGYAWCWTEIVRSEGDEVFGAVVAFKKDPASTVLPHLEHLQHAAALVGEAVHQKVVDEQLKLVASVYEASSEGIMITDAKGMVLAVNPAFSLITGFDASEAVGRLNKLFSIDEPVEKKYPHIEEALHHDGHWKGEIQGYRKNGAAFPVGATINTILDQTGRIVRRVYVFSDITDKKITEERIKYLATHDVLTELPNRLLFQDRLQQALISAQRDGSHVGLLYIDLDHFKPVNDTHGHAVGDRLLQDVAVRMSGGIRESDTVARIGGDEFVVLLPVLKSLDDAIAVGEKIMHALCEPFTIEGNAIRISASIGVAMYPRDGTDERALSQSADIAMYRAKQHGRNKIEAYGGDRGRTDSLSA